MATFKNTLTLLVVCAILAVALGQAAQGGPHTSQGGSRGPQIRPHDNQGRSRRQVDQGGQSGQGGQDAQVGQTGQDDARDDDDNDNSPPKWTTCDYNVDPRLSCVDCNTRVICKPIGGLVKACNNPRRPHCNNGLCSPVPSAECA